MLDKREHEKCFYFCNQVEYIDDRLSNLKVCIMRIPSPEGPESLQCWATNSDATARLKMAEPAELSHFEPSRAIKLAHNQNGLGSAHELAQPG